MMTIKLFCDEDTPVALATALRKRGYDVVHVNDLKRKGKTDEEQLRYAALQERCLVSFNIKDFVLLHYTYLQRGEAHWGIIVSKQLPLGSALQKLLRILQECTRESMQNRLVFL
jgi:predicted nuclease of predicted toxin-antitoxin system